MAEQKFRITLDGTLFKYNGKDPTVVIPANVVRIGQSAFEQNNYIKQVILPEGLEEIDIRAFSDCKNLERFVHLHETKLSYIDGCAFAGCEKLETMTLPPTLATLKPNVFWETGLINIRIPEKVTKIPHELFKDCKDLVTAIFDATDNIEFDDDVFNGCDNLKYIMFASDDAVRLFENPARILGSAKPDFITFATFGLIRNPAENKWFYAKRDEKGNFSVR